MSETNVLGYFIFSKKFIQFYFWSGYDSETLGKTPII